MSGTDDIVRTRKDFRAPYGGKNHVPTVQQYRQSKQDQQGGSDGNGLEESSKKSQAWGSAYQWWYGKDGQDDQDQPGKSASDAGGPTNSDQPRSAKQNDDQLATDTSQVAPGAADPKARRKEMKHGGRSRANRDVTDPVTHLPITIHDYTDTDLKAVDEGSDTPRGLKRLTMKLRGKTDTGFSEAHIDQQDGHHAMQQNFPPPEYGHLKDDLDKIYLVAVCSSVGGIIAVGVLTLAARIMLSQLLDKNSSLFVVFGVKWVLLTISPVILSVFIFAGVQTWARRHSRDLLEDDIWQSNNAYLKKNYSKSTESTQWLNEFLGSVWPLVNPDLFLSLADTLEDVMQASLPSLVRMVSVEDLGQGSESMRILGIRWLPKAAAAKSVSNQGVLESDTDGKSEIPDNDDGSRRHNKDPSEENDEPQTAKKNDSGGHEDTEKDAEGREEETEEQADGQQQGNDDDENEDGVQDGMEAEEGDFVNLEIAFAYKPREQRKTFRDRSKNAHLLMVFYLPGGIKIPVWVELRGLVGTMRMRSQLTPDPPFLALSTITLLGQPKVDVSCIPLNKKGLNIMDVPLISNFVQSAVDAAMSEYVAPKSLTLDLKAMLAGDDFKKDTTARGVIIVKIKRAFDFKAGDMSIPFFKEGSSDGYVSVGWAKFGKPVFSTRVIVNDMEPWWMEEAQLLVGPEELDAGESLRLQLWDSDRLTADDDLGRIEVPVKDIMRSDDSNGKMYDREDPFKALKAGETMPGRCEWSVGYFSKTRLLDYQMEEQKVYPNCHTREELKETVYRKAERKLRQAVKDERAEIEQLKEDDYNTAQTEIISSTRPAEDYPSGLLSIQIHQITGLGVEALSRSRENDGGEAEGEEEDADTLPSSYATIILNGKKTYKTRVKPKNAKPFFNAGCERFIRDWRNTEVYISVRDARIHENDPILGLVYLPLAKLLRDQKTSHFHSFFPLTGGVGYGRVRISCVFRSVQLQAPEAALGWDYGTVSVEKSIVGMSGLPKDLHSCKLRLRTPIGYGKMHASKNANNEDQQVDGVWESRHDRPVMIPVRNRYSVCVLIEFRHASRGLFGGEKSPAFAVLWLQDIPDDKQSEVILPVFKGDMWRATASALPEEKRGEKLGEIKFTVTFLRGLGHWHRPLAKKNVDVANVFELLDAATDNNLIDGIVGEGIAGKKDFRQHSTKHEPLSESDTSDTGSDSNDDDANPRGMGESSFNDGESSGVAAANSENAHSSKTLGGIVNEAKAYKRHKEQLHRRHRGVMQWKGARTVDWMKSKTGSISHRLSGAFDYKEREPDIETEA